FSILALLARLVLNASASLKLHSWTTLIIVEGKHIPGYARLSICFGRLEWSRPRSMGKWAALPTQFSTVLIKSYVSNLSIGGDVVQDGTGQLNKSG
ncbi:9583_t:CDS:1, partial [Acaulospora colombiana]